MASNGWKSALTRASLRCIRPFLHGHAVCLRFLPPDDYSGYKEVKEALRGSGIMLTTAEHEYTRYGFRRLIEDRSVDIIQPDITWLGGITEARRVVALAAGLWLALSFALQSPR